MKMKKRKKKRKKHKKKKRKKTTELVGKTITVCDVRKRVIEAERDVRRKDHRNNKGDRRRK